MRTPASSSALLPRCGAAAFCFLLCAAFAVAADAPRLGWKDFVDDIKDSLEDKANDYIDLIDDLGGDETAEDLRDSLDDLRNGKDEKDGAPAAPSFVPPAMQLTLQHATLRAGGLLDMRITALYGQGVFDIYLVAQTMDGVGVCLDGRGNPHAAAVPFAAGWTAQDITDAPLLQKILPLALAPGRYRVALVCLPAGGNPLDPAQWASVSDAPFTVETGE